MAPTRSLRKTGRARTDSSASKSPVRVKKSTSPIRRGKRSTSPAQATKAIAAIKRSSSPEPMADQSRRGVNPVRRLKTVVAKAGLSMSPAKVIKAGVENVGGLFGSIKSSGMQTRFSASGAKRTDTYLVSNVFSSTFLLLLAGAVVCGAIRLDMGRYLSPYMRNVFGSPGYIYAMVGIYHIMTFLLFPFACSIAAILQSGGPFQCQDPIGQRIQLGGFTYRLGCAMNNFIEGYSMLLGALVTSVVLKVPDAKLFNLLLTFFVARIFYTIGYAMNCSKMRSFAWFIGNLSCLALFIMGIFKVSL